MRIRDVLVVELLGGFGDVLLVLPAVHALARHHPGAAVRVLTFAPGDQLLRRDPLVAEVIAATDHTAGAPRAAVERELARRRYDLVVTTTTYDGIAGVCAAGAPRAVTNLWRSPPAGERVDRRFLRLLAAEGLIAPDDVDLPLRVQVTRAELTAGEAALAGLLAPAPAGRHAHLAGPPDRQRPPVVLVPGAGMPVKRWPADRWQQLAQLLHRRGHPVLAVGEAGAEPLTGTTAVPPGSLRELAATFAAVAGLGGVVVGGDTGPTRLATAVGARAVGLYGPTPAGRYGLDPRTAVNLQGLPGCPVRRPASITEQECWWTARCPLSAGGEAACLADVSVAAVHQAVLAGLRGSDQGRRGAADG